jgi:hypothetical protein
MRILSGQIFLITLSLIMGNLAFAQDSTRIVPDGYGEIQLSSTIDKKEVPKNRTVTYRAQLEWQGNLGMFQILEVSNPQVENFEIVENSVIHRTEIRDGQPVAVKIYEFRLAPLSLGMGYAGDVVIRYKNMVTNDEGHLMANRLGAKVVDPIADPREYFLFIPKAWLFPLIIILLAFLIIVPLTLWWRRRQAAIKAEKERLAAQVALEETYLKNLKTNVDLNSSDSITQFAEISRILRHYLAEKYKIQALETTTGKIVESLKTHVDDKKYLENITEILKTCDLAKFSGGGLSGSELARTYTLVESILEQVPDKQEDNPKSE